MKNSTKGMLAAIPLVMGLAGPAAAAFGESADADDHNSSPVSIDSLLNRFSGITPGELTAIESENQNIPPSQKLTAFTKAATAMSSYYTVIGGERVFSAPLDTHNRQVADDAAAPSGLTSAVRLAPESLGAVATGISPSSASPSYQAPSYQASIIPVDTSPVPIPAAIILLVSGLTALAPLHMSTRKKLVQIT